MRFADGAAEAEARAWIEGLLDERLPEDTSLHECLKSGEVLCRAVNAIAPGTVRSIYTGGLPFKQMENVEKYLVACDKLGVPSFERFPTVALYENKDMASVVNNLLALGRAAQQQPGYDREGPSLGAKLAVRNTRSFSDQQLAQARAAPTKWCLGSSGGASQAGTVIGSSNVRAARGTEGLGTGGEASLIGRGSRLDGGPATPAGFYARAASPAPPPRSCFTAALASPRDAASAARDAASAVEGQHTEPCSSYRLDMQAAEFGACECGFPRRAHVSLCAEESPATPAAPRPGQEPSTPTPAPPAEETADADEVAPLPVAETAAVKPAAREPVASEPVAATEADEAAEPAADPADSVVLVEAVTSSEEAEAKAEPEALAAGVEEEPATAVYEEMEASGAGLNAAGASEEESSTLNHLSPSERLAARRSRRTSTPAEPESELEVLDAGLSLSEKRAARRARHSHSPTPTNQPLADIINEP